MPALRRERAATREGELLEALLEARGTLAVALDSNGRIVRFNRTCEVATDYSLLGSGPP